MILKKDVISFEFDLRLQKKRKVISVEFHRIFHPHKNVSCCCDGWVGRSLTHCGCSWIMLLYETFIPRSVFLNQSGYGSCQFFVICSYHYLLIPLLYPSYVLVKKTPTNSSYTRFGMNTFALYHSSQ